MYKVEFRHPVHSHWHRWASPYITLDQALFDIEHSSDLYVFRIKKVHALCTTGLSSDLHLTTMGGIDVSRYTTP